MDSKDSPNQIINDKELSDYIVSEMKLSKRTTKDLPGNYKELAKYNTVFPITLFPDTIILDTSKVTIVKRTFFGVSETISLRIEDILHVSLSLGPFFGSITLETRFFMHEKSQQICWLSRKDAIDLKHLIQGYVIALHNKTDISLMNKNDLLKLVNELGHDPNK